MNQNISKATALLSLVPDAEFVIRGDEIEWKNYPSPPVTIEEIVLEQERLQLDYDRKEYQRLRRREYPLLEDLADAIYWQSQGDDSKMAAYLAAVDAVKSKYPKGISE